LLRKLATLEIDLSLHRHAENMNRNGGLTANRCVSALFLKSERKARWRNKRRSGSKSKSGKSALAEEQGG
jgi:hypothetical protein